MWSRPPPSRLSRNQWWRESQNHWASKETQTKSSFSLGRRIDFRSPNREKCEIPLYFRFKSLHDYRTKKAAHDVGGQRAGSRGSASERTNHIWPGSWKTDQIVKKLRLSNHEIANHCWISPDKEPESISSRWGYGSNSNWRWHSKGAGNRLSRRLGKGNPE